MACSREYIEALKDSGDDSECSEVFCTTDFLQELPESDDRCSYSSSSENELNDEDCLENVSCFDEMDIDTEGDENSFVDESNHLRCIYPVNGPLNSILIVSAALAILVIEKNISQVAFNSLTDVLLVTGFIQVKFTWTSMMRILKRRLFYSRVPAYDICLNDGFETCFFDLRTQLELLLLRHLNTLYKYRGALCENGDILCSSDELDTQDRLVIHLHLSADGGQMYKYKKGSLWPVHAVVLDLPLHIRSKPENIILLSLWNGRTKPEWPNFLDHYLKNNFFKDEFTLCVGATKLNVIVKIHTAVFDLPAMASILNHVQYNGEFGCIYCCAPGVTFQVGRGHSRKYGGIHDVLSDCQYAEYSDLAMSTNQTIFGVKGKSCLSDYMQLPSHVLLDPLHLLFENCSKSFILKLTQSSSFREKYFLGRHIEFYDREFLLIRLPRFVSRPRSLNDISCWKGRDFMTFIFYFSVPTIYKSLRYKIISNEYAFHFLVFVYSIKLCYSETARYEAMKIKDLFDYFHARLNKLYDDHFCSINMHLLLHLHAQISNFGSLANCSMNLFERQFFNFKIYSHGVSSLLQQLSEKITLLKHCKSFLEVCNYEMKKELMQCLSLHTPYCDSYVFKNSGVVLKGSQLFYSEDCKNKNVSTFYAIEMNGAISYVSLRKFVLDVDLIGEAIVYETCFTDLFDIASMDLPNVPERVKTIIKDQSVFVIVRKTPTLKSVPMKFIKCPCVAYDMENGQFLLMPCLSVSEFC